MKIKEEQRINIELARVMRASSGKILASLVNQCQDLQLAEDALQEAFLSASRQWNKETPANVEAWLFVVAKRKIIDTLRKSRRQHDEQILREVESRFRSSDQDELAQPIPDERLKLIFTCCHPALNQKAQIALTLKTLCGLSTVEIARAFLVSESTLAQRLVRAKKKIAKAGIAYRVPSTEELGARLESVLAVIYLIYNESYNAYQGLALSRDDLASEAIRLAEVLLQLLNEPEVAGLLALMRLHQARSDSRSDANRDYIPLQQQDRTRWQHQKIKQARSMLISTLAKGRPGKYQIQAAISAVHCDAPNWQATDWNEICLLYETLYRIEPSPVVNLNLTMARSYREGAEKVYPELLAIEEQLSGYQPYWAARAELESRLGRQRQAKENYGRAIEMSQNAAEKSFLKHQMVAIEA